MGDVVTVKPGYARNFLLPKKKALRATEDNIAYFEKELLFLKLKAKIFKQRLKAQKIDRQQGILCGPSIHG